MDATLRTRLDALGDGLHRLRLDDGRAVVVKRRRGAPAGFFAMEAHGLRLLGGARALRVAEVVAVADDALVLADLGRGRPDRDAWARAGAALARQHARTGERFGLDRDGWCGDGAQPNTPMDDGWRFFAECRLLPQARRAREAGRLAAADVARIERLCAALPARIPAQPPSLLHGDLWSGNLHPCGDGELALIDAGAAHYGWAEAELAMLTLFGEPPAPFFAAYREAAAADAGWRGRAPVYNLYHLLNHLNLFGSGYLEAVRAALRHGA
ncbi:fructosamine kinase family protein [Luteimonas sp. RD2P54]|uniref:Fructosamine kinase family protein n=1 Tax=Luteimonas endophytica TaxID=3042023 RepID=A0ABT6J6T9_9GAMM|nr:fructosamine kinase family protein [Luteimonas endophytica]MDH5822543.1 fructosamine kinase family protein [Luteimonas endophytica]